MVSVANCCSEHDLKEKLKFITLLYKISGMMKLSFSFESCLLQQSATGYTYYVAIKEGPDM